MTDSTARDLTSIAAASLARITTYPDRQVGGPGNRAANEFVASRLKDLGFSVERIEFDCIDWEPGTAEIEAGGEVFRAHVGPYSLACDADAPLVCISTLEELEAASIASSIVLLHGEIASGQVMPKNFPFYNPERHKRIIAALEAGAVAVIAATGRDPEMVGSQYPFPLFEDGDFDVPNAYLTDTAGERLLVHAGEDVRIHVGSRRIPASAEQVVATLPGTATGRIILSAHIDSRRGSPGGLDNASGVATLLCVAELLSDYAGTATIEIVPFNGEDDYAAPGELLWLSRNEGRLGDVILGINIDDLGMWDTHNHVSFYGCPPEVEAAVREVMPAHETLAEGPTWFQSDHAVLSMNGCPAIALTSSDMVGFMERYAHSERDTPELADPALIAEAARFIRDVIGRIS